MALKDAIFCGRRGALACVGTARENSVRNFRLTCYPMNSPLSTAAVAVDLKLNRLLWGACVLLAVVLPLWAALALWLTPPGSALGLPAAVSFEPWQLAAAWLLGLLPALCAGLGFWVARGCFSSFARGEYFSASSVRSLRGLGLGMLASGVAGLAVPTLLWLMLGWNLPAGQRPLWFNIGSQQLLLLVFAAIVWQIAGALQRGIELARENEAFV